MQKRIQELTYENEDLKEEKQRLITKFNKTEESYQNQIKVTKNLELNDVSVEGKENTLLIKKQRTFQVITHWEDSIL